MTKIITKLPVSAEDFKNFRETELKKMIAAATAKLEENFSVLCLEFTNRFNANEWIFMSNQNFFYVNEIFGLFPDASKRTFYTQHGNENYMTSDTMRRLNFEKFVGDFPTEYEARSLFNDRVNYFRDTDGDIKMNAANSLSYAKGLTIKNNSSYFYMYTRNGGNKYRIATHGTWTSDLIATIPIFRFGAKDTKGNAAQAILKWIEFDLIPNVFKSDITKNFFYDLKNYKDYLKVDGEKIIFDQDKIFSAILNGMEFDFLPDAKKILSSTEVEANNNFLNELRDELLNGDKKRADIDSYDENILTDPNRGHWDLWDYGEGEETAGEIILPEGMTARDPADDINHGIVAIDFGTKSTVVVYENDNMQILPLQVSGNYSKGVKAKNYENPTVIQFINLKNFVEAYNARAGRPKTKWNDVTVSHTAFENLTTSDSKNYYSFLTELKHWCGSDDRIKIKDRNGFTEDLPPFLELVEGDINPLEYYAYYLGLYINNMTREKGIFLKYIMSFPVTYDNSVRKRMRRVFSRGIKKSFPTALLSNEEVMKNFIVQDGASEPAAYAITALQEYNFDPEDDEENYYAVFDFGGGTTDFDFGVLRESEKDRYDYSLIHFGENGDKTLGGENLLKLLAFEIFKANQETLLKPKKDDGSVGKIPFTFAADKKDFVGSDALIKDSQEAHLNMHNLAEKLRPVWEDPDGDEAKKILEGNAGIEVELFTDKGVHLTNFILHTAFENFKLDLKKILRGRIERGIENFFIAMREAFLAVAEQEDFKIQSLQDIEEISIFLAGNSSKSKFVTEIFSEYLGQVPEKNSDDDFPFDDEGILKVGYKLKDGYFFEKGILAKEKSSDAIEIIGTVDNPVDREKFISAFEKWNSKKISAKLEKILGITSDESPQFKIYPALGTPAAKKIQEERGVKINPNDIAAPTGKTGVAFGLLKCRDSGNVEITHITPTDDQTPFQFYIGRNKKRKFKTVISKSTKLGTWYKFIDAGNNFDILYSDLPEAVDSMDVQKAKRVNVTLEKHDPNLNVFIRAVKSNVIEYQVAENIEDLDNAEKMNGVEPVPITLT